MGMPGQTGSDPFADNRMIIRQQQFDFVLRLILHCALI